MLFRWNEEGRGLLEIVGCVRDLFMDAFQKSFFYGRGSLNVECELLSQLLHL